MDEEKDFLQLYLSAPGNAGGTSPLSSIDPLIDTHQRALAASRSVIERMREGHVTISTELAAAVLMAVVERVEAIEAMLAARDPDARFSHDLDAFVEQYIGRLFDNALRMLDATGKHISGMAGEDIRAVDEAVVDELFGAVVLPSYSQVLRPVKGADGKTTYTVEDPSGFNRRT